MNRATLRHSRGSAFTLIEIALALAIIATALVALLGLLPAGLDASRQAVNSTVVAAVLENVHIRLQGHPLKMGPATFSPLFFDDHGIFIQPDAEPEELARRLYRADVQISEWKERPANTSALRPTTISLSWPVDLRTGDALGTSNPKTVVTYGVTTLTGPDWQLIDRKYVPKVEF